MVSVSAQPSQINDASMLPKLSPRNLTKEIATASAVARAREPAFSICASLTAR